MKLQFLKYINLTFTAGKTQITKKELWIVLQQRLTPLLLFWLV